TFHTIDYGHTRKAALPFTHKPLKVRRTFKRAAHVLARIRIAHNDVAIFIDHIDSAFRPERDGTKDVVQFLQPQSLNDHAPEVAVRPVPPAAQCNAWLAVIQGNERCAHVEPPRLRTVAMHREVRTFSKSGV